MQRRTMAVSLSLMLALLLGACAPASPQTSSSGPARPGASKKQIVASVFSSPAGLHQELTNPQGTSGRDRKSTRLNSSHSRASRMPSSA